MARKGERDAGYGERARGFLSEEIRHHVKEKGMPQDQAVAAAMSEARRKGLAIPRDVGRSARKQAPAKKGGARKRTTRGGAKGGKKSARKTTTRKRTTTRRRAAARTRR